MLYNAIIADDHAVFRMGLSLLLEKIGTIGHIAEASNGHKVVELCSQFSPDLIFMDISMPELDGIATTRCIRNFNSSVKIIALSSYCRIEFVEGMLNAGANGYMMKDETPAVFRIAIQQVMDGKQYFSSSLLDMLIKSRNIGIPEHIQHHILDEFTSREIEVYRLLCDGASNQIIGDTLNISSRTIERYKTILMQKTGTSSTLNLVIYAHKHKLFFI